MTSNEKTEAPRVIKHQDDDGQEWFEIADERYLSLERDPEKEDGAGYFGTEIILKFNRDGVHGELKTHWGLDDAVMQDHRSGVALRPRADRIH